MTEFVLRNRKGAQAATAIVVAASPAPSLCREKLAFRCFRPPWPVRVLARKSKPVYVDAEEKLSAPVVACAGPWRVAGEWWTPEKWQYEEWDVELEERLYRACRDRITQEWMLTGAYD